MQQFGRRRALALAGAGLGTAVAGCLGSDRSSQPTDEPPTTDDLSGHVRPEDDPETVPPALSCDETDFERHPAGYDADELAWGDTTETDGTPQFALRVDQLAYDYGETATITLTNVSDEEQHTGTSDEYSIEVQTAAGWQDVRGTSSDRSVVYNDLGIVHPPGEAFEWTLELTKTGLVAEHPLEDRLRVCPDLPAGRYRFVFWALNVAVAFDLAR
ncbi:hypothetical protein ACFR9U_06120 [Halorientalis brevis]|uniref:F5/8 type C domain-containing protein n=1 Tax=Halorientalis brevis TaxID=1126241 RepID=A0ABD6C914_9EURY|nr:hypothetical protein [Halorientalis brevis]